MTTQFRTQNGIWRVASTDPIEPGSVVQVARRNGQLSSVRITAQIAHDLARDLPYLYSFQDQRAASGATTITRTEHVANAERLFALFERARQHSHTVAVRFDLTNTTRGLRLELAGPSSRYAGQLLALTEQRNGRSRRSLYGVLSASGSFAGTVGPTGIELEIYNEVLQALRNFSEAPASYAAAHGRATGNCCFCGRGLTDARSVAVGYGPICADHYGLPWGDAPDFDVAQGSQRQMERLADNAGAPNAFDGSDQPERAAAVSTTTPPIAQPVAEGNVVTTTARRIRPADAAAQPAMPRPRLTGIARLQERARERARARELANATAADRAVAPTDETVTTVVRTVQRDPNRALEEDDFIWPPLQPQRTA